MKSAAMLILILLPVLALAETMQATRELVLSADSLDTLIANCGAGSLTLRGKVQRRDIRVSAQIEVEASGEFDYRNFVQETVQLTLEKQARTAILHSALKQSAALMPETRINLTIEIPANLNVYINDGSGSIRVRDLNGRLQINDESGSIKIMNIEGEIRVADGSGSIVVEDITGRVFVNDGSGTTTIESVKGDVQIKDGSGSLTLVGIDGNVTISDGSGSIDIQNVQKNVFIYIREEGSGEVNVERVKGKVTIRP